MLAEAFDVLMDDLAGHLLHDPLVVDAFALVDAAKELRKVPRVSLDGVART
jgi:hypothetical protein